MIILLHYLILKLKSLLSYRTNKDSYEFEPQTILPANEEKKSRRMLSKEEIKTIKKLHAKGKSSVEIAKVLDVPYQNVYYWMKKGKL